MHTAIIMDGNGRWAARRGLPRSSGHRAGARAVRRAVEHAARTGVDILTLYAFSSDNWMRPAEETGHLMRLLKRYLLGECAHCVENGVRLEVIGRRDRLPADVIAAIERAEHLTREGPRLHLRLAIDYSARQIIERAAREYSGHSPEEFSACLARAGTHASTAHAVDLLIRTGGEKRLSDFLLWECAYAELVFIDACWPDFDEARFQLALDEYANRQRRFGALPVSADTAQAGAS